MYPQQTDRRLQYDIFYADELLEKNHNWSKGIRSIGIGLDRLSGAYGEQLCMFPESYPVPTAAKRLTEVAERFGGIALERI